MKKIANIIIINNQNVKSEHLAAVTVTYSFQRRKLCLCLDEFHRSHQHWTAKTATGWPEIPQTLANWTAFNYLMQSLSRCLRDFKSSSGSFGSPVMVTSVELVQAINKSYCMEYKCVQFSIAVFDAHACSYYMVTATKGCSVNILH